MQSLLYRIKGYIYISIHRLGIFRFPLWILNFLLSRPTLKFLLRLSIYNLKIPAPARVAEMEFYLKKLKEQKSPVSCLVIGGWALEGYPKLIATYMPVNSTLKCVDSYEQMSNSSYQFSRLEKISQKYAALAFQLALKNKELIECRFKLNVELLCSKTIPNLVELYDLIFIDTSIQYDTYKTVLENSYTSLSDGGVIIGDDFELELPISELLLEECNELIDHDLIYSQIVKGYVHPGIVLGLHNFMYMHPDIQVEAHNGIYIIRKNSTGPSANDG